MMSRSLKPGTDFDIKRVPYLFDPAGNLFFMYYLKEDKMKKSRSIAKLTVLLLSAVMVLMMGSTALVFADEAAPTIPDSVTMTGRPSNATKQADVSLALTNASDEWMSKVTEVSVDGTPVEKREAKTGEPVDDSDLTCDINEWGIVKTGTGKTASYTLAVPTAAFNKTPKRLNTYKIVVKAEGYADLTQDLKVTCYGADVLIIREKDKDGKVLKEKTYTAADIEKMSKYQTGVLYEGLCSHHGIRGFNANGIEIKDILADAGIEFKSGDELRLRTNDADKSAEAVNDDPANDHYYCEGGFSYDYLYKPRYAFTDLYKAENPALYAKLIDLQGQTTVVGETTFHNYLNPELRQAIAEGKKKEVAPFIATEMYENDLDYVTAPGTNYGTTKSHYGFRFFYGFALEEDGKAVEKDEMNQRVSYYVYGIDIQHDTTEHALDRSELEAEVVKTMDYSEADYTAETWAPFKEAFDKAKILVYVVGLNQNVKEHAKTDQAYIVQRLNELKAAEEGLVKIQKKTTIKVTPASKKLKAKSLKKKAQNFSLKAKVSSGQKATFKKTAGSKKITVSKTGKVTVKKGVKKGTYKITVKVTSKATDAYKAGSTTAKIKIVVK